MKCKLVAMMGCIYAEQRIRYAQTYQIGKLSIIGAKQLGWAMLKSYFTTTTKSCAHKSSRMSVGWSPSKSWS